MWAVRVAVGVGELVVLAMRRDPVDHGPFGGGGPERGESRPGGAVALEAAVGQQPVEADGYPCADGHVEQGQDQDVLPVQEVPGPAEPHAYPHHDWRQRGDDRTGEAIYERHLNWPHVPYGRTYGRRSHLSPWVMRL